MSRRADKLLDDTYNYSLKSLVKILNYQNSTVIFEIYIRLAN